MFRFRVFLLGFNVRIYIGVKLLCHENINSEFCLLSPLLYIIITLWYSQLFHEFRYKV